MIIRLISFLSPIILFAQTSEICGIWLEEKKQSHIEIYEIEPGRFEGKIIWLAEPFDENGDIKRDNKNPKNSLRSQSLKGLKIIKNLEYIEDTKWSNGSIYDARSGKTYSLNANLEDQNTLFLT